MDVTKARKTGLTHTAGWTLLDRREPLPEKNNKKPQHGNFGCRQSKAAIGPNPKRFRVYST